MVHSRKNKPCYHRPTWQFVAHVGYVAFLLIFSIIIVPYVTANWDPYEVLGVQRDASLVQIKKAYRESARKLHPDKSSTQNEGDTSQRFIELNKAFNILRDPNKRNRYDQYGDTDENRFTRANAQYQRHNNAREHWSRDGYRTFTVFSSTDSQLRKRTITTKQYYSKFLKESKYKPFIIFFYSDFCPTCTMIESTWAKIVDELAKFNVGSFTINVYTESRLAVDLGVDSIPYIGCLLDGKFGPYSLTELSLKSIVKFVKTQLPHDLIDSSRYDYEQDRFINNAITNNRLAVIIFDDERSLKLRYSLLAFELRQYYQFSHISTKLSDYQTFAKRYGMSGSLSAKMLVFNENISQPALTIHLKPDESDYVHIRQKLVEWPFLKLPRISSQERFDDLCHYAVPKGDKAQVKVCSILFTRSTPSSAQARMKMIEFSELNNLARNARVIFAYIDPTKQKEFVLSIVAETADAQPKFVQESLDDTVILIERHQQHIRKAKFKWIYSRWNPDKPDELDRAKVELHQYINDYLHHNFELPNKMALSTLIDEEGSSLLERIYKRIFDYTYRILQFITSKESFLTVAILMACACMTSLMLFKPSIDMPMQQEDASEDDQKFKNEKNEQVPQSCPVWSGVSKLDDDLKIIELCAGTYNGMIRLLKPGFRSIILLTDREAFNTLMPKFKQAVWSYRRNKTLLFGYLCLDKNLDWYRSLLEEMLGVEELVVNKKNCIGTVLSLNGFKKYLRVYHAKHHEGVPTYDNDEPEDSGSFLGFNDGDTEPCDIEQPATLRANAREHNICEVEHLLDRLSIWLDKMFDGLTKRYFLERWPEEIR